MDCGMPGFASSCNFETYTNSCPLSPWCHPSYHPLSSLSLPTFNLSQHQGLFQRICSSHQVAKVLEFQLQYQSFQWIFRVDFLSDWLVWTPCCPRASQESSPALQFERISSLALSLIYRPTLTCIHDSWETIALTIQIFISKVMSLLFNMLSRFVIAFPPKIRHLLISWLQCLSTVILEPRKIKSVTVSTVSPCICHEVMGPDAMILVFWTLILKPNLSLFYFHQEPF